MDPVANPLTSKSGKFEIYCQQIIRMKEIMAYPDFGEIII